MPSLKNVSQYLKPESPKITTMNKIFKDINYY